MFGWEERLVSVIFVWARECVREKLERRQRKLVMVRRGQVMDCAKRPANGAH